MVLPRPIKTPWASSGKDMKKAFASASLLSRLLILEIFMVSTPFQIVLFKPVFIIRGQRFGKEFCCQPRQIFPQYGTYCSILGVWQENLTKDGSKRAGKACSMVVNTGYYSVRKAGVFKPKFLRYCEGMFS